MREREREKDNRVHPTRVWQALAIFDPLPLGLIFVFVQHFSAGAPVMPTDFQL